MNPYVFLGAARGRWPLVLLLAFVAVAGPSGPVRASEAVESSIESLIRRNPRGRQIVEDMARSGVEDAIVVLCQAGVASANSSAGGGGEGSDADRLAHLGWCSRGAALGHPGALRELGMRLLSDGDARRKQEGVTVLTLAEVVGHSAASLEVALLPDFFDVTATEIGRGRQEAFRRIEQGRFHDARKLGFTFEFSKDERESMQRRRRTFLENTAALDAGLEGLTRQLDARRARAEQGEVVSQNTRDAHRRQLQAKDALQRRLSFELKRASREDVVLSDREQRAREDRRERLRLGAELHTGRVDHAGRQSIEAELESLLRQINRHRAKDAAVRLSDLGLPWRSNGVAAAGAGLAAGNAEGTE